MDTHSNTLKHRCAETDGQRQTYIDGQIYNHKHPID
uniref:Uncharacterized protein n=1 Tax=Anguilla anguilla TaxID=7936 RepID=A0A0E9UTH6_ANGAN